MEAKPPIPIDITDPADIEQKMPTVERFIKAKRREVERWERFADNLAEIAGIERVRTGRTAGTLSKSKKASAQTQVVAILNDVRTPLRVGEVAELLDEPFKRDTVSWALWQAEQDKQIQRIKTGVYAAKDYKLTQQELAARNGTGDEP